MIASGLWLVKRLVRSCTVLSSSERISGVLPIVFRSAVLSSVGFEVYTEKRCENHVNKEWTMDITAGCTSTSKEFIDSLGIIPNDTNNRISLFNSKSSEMSSDFSTTSEYQEFAHIVCLCDYRSIRTGILVKMDTVEDGWYCLYVEMDDVLGRPPLRF